jgi:cytoskeleton protein RodZ
MADGEGTSLTSSPGARLAVARKQAGMSLSEAAERLHLNLQTLEAMEAGRLEALGASVYARGHLKRYAELLGVPESEVMATYDAWSGRLATLPDLREVITAPAVRSGTRRFELKPAHALVGAIVLVAVMVVWWAMRRPARTNVVAGAPPKTQEAVAPAGPPIREAAPAPQSAPAPQTAPAPRPLAATAVSAPASAAAPAATPKPVATVAQAAAGGPTVRLGMNFSEDSWIEVYGADGAQLFHGTALAGSQHHITGSAPLRVFLGNPPGVTLEMNGKPVVMTGIPRPRRFSLDDAGHIVGVQSPDSSAKGPGTEPRSD